MTRVLTNLTKYSTGAALSVEDDWLPADYYCHMALKIQLFF